MCDLGIKYSVVASSLDLTYIEFLKECFEKVNFEEEKISN